MTVPKALQNFLHHFATFWSYQLGTSSDVTARLVLGLVATGKSLPKQFHGHIGCPSTAQQWWTTSGGGQEIGCLTCYGAA